MTRAVVATTFKPLSSALPLLLLLLAGCAGKPVRIPEIRGRAIDARNGVPIAGAIVKRRLYGPTLVNLVDGSRPLPVKGGDFATRSRADGTFVLPSFGAPGLAGMHWIIYAPGWMPFEAANCEAKWSSDGCSGFDVRGEDPWTSVTFTKEDDHLNLEVRLLPPTLEGIAFRSYNSYTKQWVAYTPAPEVSDPWGYYFDRLNRLTHEQWLRDDEFLGQVLVYLREHDVTEAMLLPLARLTDTVNPSLRPDLAMERCTILASISRFCGRQVRSKNCDWPAVSLCARDYKEECVRSETQQ